MVDDRIGDDLVRVKMESCTVWSRREKNGDLRGLELSVWVQ